METNIIPNASVGGIVDTINGESGMTVRGGIDVEPRLASPVQPVFSLGADASPLFPPETSFALDAGVGLNNPWNYFLTQGQLSTLWFPKNNELRLSAEARVVDIPLTSGWHVSLNTSVDARPRFDSWEETNPRLTFGVEISKKINARNASALTNLSDNLKTYFSPKKEIPQKKDINDAYDAYNFADGLLIPGAHPLNPGFDLEVILFQPISLKEGDKIIALDPEKMRGWVTKSLEKMARRGFPVDKLPIYIRREPKPFDISAVDTTGKNTAVPLEGGMEFDQNEKLTYFGHHSETIAYSYHIIPANGRSQAATLNSVNIDNTLKHPEELVRYVHPVRLVENLATLKPQDWKDNNKVGKAFLDSLWDGENFGWEAAIARMSEMEGSAVDIFVGRPDAEGNYTDKDSTEVMSHESGHSMLKLMDEYGSGEYTASVEELRAKLAGKIPDNNLEKIAVYLAAYGETPPVFAFANNLSPENIAQVLARSLKDVANNPKTGLTGAEREWLRLTAGVVDDLSQNLPSTPPFTLAEVLQNNLVEKASVYPLINVTFKEDDLWKKFETFVQPYHPELKGALCAKMGGIQEKSGTWHFEYRGDDGTCDDSTASNMRNSHSGKAPNSPFAEALLTEWKSGTPYCQRLNAPVSGFQCESLRENKAEVYETGF